MKTVTLTIIQNTHFKTDKKADVLEADGADAAVVTATESLTAMYTVSTRTSTLVSYALNRSLLRTRSRSVTVDTLTVSPASVLSTVTTVTTCKVS